MAAVSVFVDDAVRGRLPLVCAKTGEPADLVIRVQHPVGTPISSLAWLLLFLGPPGWVVFVLVTLLQSRQEYLTVRIPETDASYHREKQLEHFRLAAIVAGVAVPLCGLVLSGNFPALFLAAGAGFVLTAVALHVMVLSQNIGISLDASRRWVTLSRVHPHFVEAVQLQEVGGRVHR